ncbi:MAG: 3-deoxy-D-manno-octulosonic acid kinase [Burkholderiaceae bacterium]|nr:3-deoxy-D-manno-octulosonic acid kinase [Burkholderiaceae bacterium]MCD8515924.1 3-deoxy-D-manno-octulosonic acid kinase [Burkholderiaceae bacterium]MCD8538177.1 3-deoxy-D-manno-octulosonic acid kinase [Burkholderiaceae bacterium]MCD8565835.1 3-deoxy-D-manno-octulosonic acid kinase [Burkholderiaceae bacterium]
MSDLVESSAVQASVQAEQFGASWVWTDGSISPADALDVLRQGSEGDRSDMIRVGSGGRGSAWRLTVGGKPAVLRHYRRGGMMAHINRDQYLWQGPTLTRPYREFMVMLGLSGQGLLVPKPIAAMAKRTGLFYRAAILTRYVDHRGALCAVDDQAAWRSAGAAVARLHDAGVWHADLNVNNILVDELDQAWLIDFDRAKTGVSERSRLQGNLSRLLRSVRKVCPELEQRLWPMLLEGYAGK